MKPIHIIDADSELGAGKRGGSLGFGAMLTAARKLEQTFFSEQRIIHLPNKNIKLDRPPEHSFAKRIYLLTEYYESLSNTVAESMQDGAFPIVVTGDHSSGGAVIAGVRQCHLGSRIGVLWVDAHADMHSPYTTPSGNMHGMPLAIAMGLDNMEHRRNDVNEALETAWNRIKGAGGQTPSIDPGDLYFLGLRSVEQEEWALINKHHIPHTTVEQMRQRGVEKTIGDILSYFESCDVIHVSFDVDSMDPDLVSDGTGTPVKGGFSAGEAKALLCGLMENEKVASLEITEINPTLDTRGNVMGETAFDILQALTKILKSRADFSE